MGRIKRALYEGFLYFHLMVQGMNRENIFKSDAMKKCYIELVEKYMVIYDIEIYNFVIMDNHAHILAKVSSIKNMSKFMQCVNSQFARAYNKANNRVGHVFRDRFASKPIDTFAYFVRCLIYISLNPVKAKLVEDPADYKYSGVGTYEKNENLISQYGDNDEMAKEFEKFKDLEVPRKEKYYYLKNKEYLFENPKKVILEVFETTIKLDSLDREQRVSKGKATLIMDQLKDRTCLTKIVLKEKLKNSFPAYYKMLFGNN